MPKSFVRALPKASLAVIPVMASVLCMLSQPSTSVAIFWIGVASVVCYFVSHRLIDAMVPLLIKRGIFGRDLSKTSSDKVAEALGIVPGVVTVMSIILYHPFSQEHLLFDAATTALLLTVLTGFLDDVLDLRWKTKIALSFLATVPLIVAYDGPTNIIVPLNLRQHLGVSIELSVVYLVYMMLLAVFFTNSINLYAGVNGLESGQAVVIALSVVVHSAVQLALPDADVVANLSTLAVVLPFLASSLALFYHNAYPSRVFVGDTFTYTAGMAFAVCGILGKSSKTIMLFFVPQFINFVLSLPQLFKLLPCPRHRLPSYVANTDKMHFSTFELNGRRYMNLTLINLVLAVFGDMNEERLCFILLFLQVLSSMAAFLIRYYMASLFY